MDGQTYGHPHGRPSRLTKWFIETAVLSTNILLKINRCIGRPFFLQIKLYVFFPSPPPRQCPILTCHHLVGWLFVGYPFNGQGYL